MLFGCCLGFVGLQNGYCDNDLKGWAQPHKHMDSSFKGWPSWCFVAPNRLSKDLISVIKTNDNVLLADEQRMQELNDLFRAHGDELEFIE